MGLLLCAITIATRAQGKIELSLLNEQGQALPHASVELLRAADSTLLKIALSDEQGLAFFEAIARGRAGFIIIVDGKPTATRPQNFPTSSGENTIALGPALIYLSKANT